MILYKPEDLLRPARLATWGLLAFVAGAVNAGAFFACAQFVTHVTGIATRVGTDFGAWIPMLDYAIVFVSFVVGAMASVLLIDGRHHRGQRPLFWAPLLLVSTLLVVAALGGHAGWFGAFGAADEHQGEFALMSILSFAMGSRTRRSPPAPALPCARPT